MSDATIYALVFAAAAFSFFCGMAACAILSAIDPWPRERRRIQPAPRPAPPPAPPPPAPPPPRGVPVWRIAGTLHRNELVALTSAAAKLELAGDHDTDETARVLRQIASRLA